MASRDIKDLTLEMQEMYREWARKMIEAKIRHIVTCTARLLGEQIALYVQGRKPLAEVNHFRHLAGLRPILAPDNRIVTWTLKSKHIVRNPEDKARAFDFALVKDAGIYWDIKISVNENEIPDYEEAGKIGESIGLRWGGHWKDYCHLEKGD